MATEPNPTDLMQTQTAFKPAETTLRGVRVLSVALNLPGPAALMRLANMGAQ